MVSFTHNDAGTSEAAWAASGAAELPELPLDDAELAGRAFIVLAAHPDDESLGAGGLLARLQAVGATVRVLLCTAGEASHPGSPTTTPDQLAAVRLQEFGGALTHLLGARAWGGDREWQCLGLPDGKLAQHREQIRAAVREASAGCGRAAEEVVLVAPYRSDGHTDHDVLGSVAAELSAAAGYGLLEYPIWYWLWAAPEAPAAPDASRTRRRLTRTARHGTAGSGCRCAPPSNKPRLRPWRRMCPRCSRSPGCRATRCSCRRTSWRTSSGPGRRSPGTRRRSSRPTFRRRTPRPKGRWRVPAPLRRRRRGAPLRRRPRP